MKSPIKGIFVRAIQTHSHARRAPNTCVTKAPVPYKHGSTRQSRIVPDQDPGRSVLILGFSSVDGRPTTVTPVATRQLHGRTRTNTAATRNQHGAHTDDQRPSRTVTAERRTYTAATRTNTAATRTAPDRQNLV